MNNWKPLTLALLFLSGCITIEVASTATSPSSSTPTQPSKPQPEPNPDSGSESGSETPTPTGPTPSRQLKAEYYGTDTRVIPAVAAANKLLQDSSFYNQIRRKSDNDFSYTSDSPQEIADWMEKAKLTIRVRLYDGDRGSTTNAYVVPERPNDLFLNKDKLNRSTASIASTIVHELVHAVDRTLKNNSFGHGTNNRTNKENSAPYWIGSLAKCRIGGNTDCLNKAKSLVSDEDVIEEVPELDPHFIVD
jgi:hypothetical protein